MQRAEHSNTVRLSARNETSLGGPSGEHHRSRTVVVVDDEPIARKGLRKLLEARRDLDVVGDADSGTSALEVISRLQPDLIVLDIQLPDMCGLEVLRELSTLPLDRQPLVVFVTAFDEFAVQAFECSAADYVVKPFTDQRLMQAVDRAVIRLREQSAARSLAELVLAFQRVVPGPGREHELSAAPRRSVQIHAGGPGNGDRPLNSKGFRERFLVSVGARDAVVETANISWIRANGYYATLVMRSLKGRAGEPRSGEPASGSGQRPTERSDYLIRVSLDRLERELDPALFLRIHRSAIVRVDCIRGTERTPRRGITVVLEDGTRIAVSRGRREALLRALGRTS